MKAHQYCLNPETGQVYGYTCIEFGDNYASSFDFFLSHWRGLAKDPTISDVYEHVYFELVWQ